VLGNLRAAMAPLLAIEARYNALTEAGDMGDEYEHLLEEMNHKEIWELDSRLEQAANALGLPPFDATSRSSRVASGRRVALCKLLLQHPDMLLLDEPTNHLDTDAVEWLEEHLKAYHGTVILITHDRYFLDNVVGWMLEIERGLARPYKGNYSEYLEQKQRELDTKKGQSEAREKIIARELEWIRKTPKARNTRSKSRLARFEDLKMQRAEDALDVIELRIPPGPRLGDKVIELRNVKKGYGDRVLINDLTFEVPPGGVLGIIGPNGRGKTTLCA
jgi:ATPase subunit of ABC transporter with duplicated ATPase domains